MTSISYCIRMRPDDHVAFKVIIESKSTTQEKLIFTYITHGFFDDFSHTNPELVSDLDYDTPTDSHGRVYEMIIAAAKKHGCDGNEIVLRYILQGIKGDLTPNLQARVQQTISDRAICDEIGLIEFKPDSSS